MEYEVKYLQENEIVTIKPKGRLNFQTAENYSKEAVKLARQKYCSNFLIDHSETKINEEGSTNFHASAGELQQFGFLNTDKVALILSDNDKITNLADLSNQNSRWSCIKHFTISDYNKAINWLTASEKE